MVVFVRTFVELYCAAMQVFKRCWTQRFSEILLKPLKVWKYAACKFTWESGKFCSFMKIRIVWLQISSSLSVAVQLYSTFLPIVKKVDERAWVLITYRPKQYLRTWYTQVWHFCQNKYNEDQNTHTKKTLNKLWGPLLSLKRIAADALLLRRWCCFASVGFGMSLQKKIQTPSWIWIRFHVNHQFKPVLSIDKDLLSRVLLSNIDLIVLFN